MRAFTFIFLAVSCVIFSVGSRVCADPVPFARDQLLADLTRDLTSHFNLEGDLQLELVRPWVPPSLVAEAWTLELLEYPSMPT
jgi:flagella basal body P-ring formation protein FlgA